MVNTVKANRLIQISDIQSIYLAITAIFLLTGFVYNYVYFRFFNIEVERYFTIQDYLASSLEKVYLIIVAIPFAFVSSNIARYFVLEKKKTIHHRILTFLVSCGPMVIFATGIIMLNNSHPMGYYLLSFSIFAGCDYLLYKMIFKGDHGSYFLYFYFNTFFFYLLIIISTATYQRDLAMSQPLHNLTKNHYHFARDFNINQDTCIVLESNDNFFFFYDKQLNKTYIIPKDGISYIETFK